MGFRAAVIILIATMGTLGPWTVAQGGVLHAPTRANGEPPRTPTARHFEGTDAVGPLFPPGSRVHTCTASVVQSNAGNLLITAAHCISGTATGYVFVPGYHDGIEPLGSWTVVGAYGAPGWLARRSQRDDFAFLVVAPHRVNGHPQQIEGVTGAYELGTAPRPGARVTVPAYAIGSDDVPLTCTVRVYYDRTFPAFNCNPYVDGTSGAPWVELRGRHRTVVGVIGGLHQGGCYAWTSYSAPFDGTTLRTASSAARHRPSTFPSAGSDGCSTGL